MAYVQALKGYVADVPEFFFERIDKKRYHFDRLTQASVTPNVQFTEVNAGWGLYPVAYLPAQSSLEAQLTSGQFDSSLFELANGENFTADTDFILPMTETFVLDGTGRITLKGKVEDVSKIVINGLTYSSASTPAKGTFTATTSGDITTVTVKTGTGEAGDFEAGYEVEVHYQVKNENAVSMTVKNEQAAIGKAVLRWPVYHGGEATNTTSMVANNVKGYIVMTIYRCRVTAMPGFDTSYKSAATNAITLSTMDPGYNSEGAAYKLTYVPNV